MSQSSDHASLGNSKEAPHSDLPEDELLDAIASADEATGESIAAPARDVIACKIANVVDGMEGIQRNHNGRYPAHSIDQVVSAVSPLISVDGLRIKTEALDIELFSVLANMPFWRESNGRQEQYTRDAHLFRMKLLFTVINGATGECDAHQWTRVFEIGRSGQDQDCGAAVSYGAKDFLKRQFMIADDSDDPDFKGGGGTGRINPQALDGQLTPGISIEPNTRKRSERSPGWFAKDESGRISIALWESWFKTIDMLLRWNSGTIREILGENEDRHRFNTPLMLRVKANQHGLNLAADGQLNTLENPAVADQFMQIARNIIPGLSTDQAAEYLDVAQLADFQADMGTALQVIQTAKRYAGEANGDGDPLSAAHGLPSDAFGDFQSLSQLTASKEKLNGDPKRRPRGTRQPGTARPAGRPALPQATGRRLQSDRVGSALAEGIRTGARKPRQRAGRT